MADALEVTVHGLPELIAGSRSLFAKIEKSASKRFGDVAERRARIAAASVPRISGTLAASVTSEENRAEMGGDVPYAGWVEFGGGRGRPYVPEGRYFYPVTRLRIEDELTREGTEAAQKETRGFQWPSPRI